MPDVFDPAPWSTDRKALCHARPFSGACDKYLWLDMR